MNYQHPFIFTHGEWVGEGKVTISSSPAIIHYYTRWETRGLKDDEIHATQHIEMQTAGDSMVNTFRLFNITATTFQIQLSNELLGTATGIGFIADDKLGWEFRGHQIFEGFEIYRQVAKDEYSVHAEYNSSEDYRTTVNGRVWKKTSL